MQVNKRAGLLALASVLAGCGWMLLSWSGDHGLGEPVQEPAGASVSDERAGLDEMLIGPEAQSAIEQTPKSRELVPEAAPAPMGNPSFRVFGKIQDSKGWPISGVKISLETLRGPWAPGVAEVEFTTSSDSEGRFDLLTPLPTSSLMELSLVPTRFYSLAGRYFSMAGGSEEESLVQGDNDLGTFTLQTTGAISGLVRLADGADPSVARVTARGGASGVDPSGRFVIEHVPAGTYTIKIEADGYLPAGLPEVLVEPRILTEGCHVTLESSPVIAGRVVDEGGAPIQGVRVSGRTIGWDITSAHDVTDSLGRFSVQLLSDEKHMFTVEREGYKTLSEDEGGDWLILAPGTTGHELVLRQATHVTILVRDAASGIPIDRFGLAVDLPEDSWGGSRESVPLESYPGGLFETYGEPDLHILCIQAPGYAPISVRIEVQAESGGQQVVGLLSEGRMRGRVVFEGRAIAKAVLHVEAGLVGPPGKQRPGEGEPGYEDMIYDMGEYVGRERSITCDDQGEFELGELATGTYRMEVRADVGYPLVLEDIRVTAGETLELGDLNLKQGAEVRGRLILDGGLTGEGLEVYVDDRWSGPEVAVNAAGEFEINRLTPGEHQITVIQKDGVIHESAYIPFEVNAGQTLELVVDLRPWQTGKLRIRVLDGGQPLAGARLALLHESGEVEWLDQECDAQGELSFDCRREGVTQLLALSSQRQLLARTTEPVVVIPGLESLVVIECHSGDVLLKLPESFEVPEHALALIFLKSAAVPEELFRTTLLVRDKRMSFYEEYSWDGGDPRLTGVEPGEYEVSVKAWSKMIEGRGVEDELGEFRFRGTVLVTAGETAICVLETQPK